MQTLEFKRRAAIAAIAYTAPIDETLAQGLEKMRSNPNADDLVAALGEVIELNPRLSLLRRTPADLLLLMLANKIEYKG